MKTPILEERVGRVDCDFRIYKEFPLAIVMLQGWFNDQHKCFELFFERLTQQERLYVFTDDRVRESVNVKYKGLWYEKEFDAVAIRNTGVHRRIGHLTPGNRRRRGFSYWLACVFNEANGAGGLEIMLQGLVTVEEAHRKFKPWFYKGQVLRGLNAADAARILARYGHLQPESIPLLARGALRGAAIMLDDQPPSKRIDELELEYGDESKRSALEKRAADYILNSGDFSGPFQMDEGESWFCALHKQWG